MDEYFRYTQNFFALLNDETEVYREMVTWMEDTLRLARQENEKVILIGHIPEGRLTLTSFALWYTDLVIEYSDVIVLHMYGHTHSDDFGLVRHTTSQYVIIRHSKSNNCLLCVQPLSLCNLSQLAVIHICN